MRGLKDKRIVVAGAATGIGAATAERLAQEGARVVIGDLNQAGAESTAARIVSGGGTATPFQFDLADAGSCASLIQHCVDLYGGIDGLANVGAETSVGVMMRDLDLLHMDEEVWARQTQVSLMGHVRTIRAAVPHFVKQRAGAIVCVSSGAAYIGEAVRPAYATNKIGLHAVVRHVARSWGPDNVRCNAVAPGFVTTKTAAEHSKDATQREYRDRMIGSLPLRRDGAPSEVGALIAFLLSDDGAWITGQILSIDGGQTMRD